MTRLALNVNFHPSLILNWQVENAEQITCNLQRIQHNTGTKRILLARII